MAAIADRSLAPAPLSSAIASSMVPETTYLAATGIHVRGDQVAVGQASPFWLAAASATQVAAQSGYVRGARDDGGRFP